MSIAVNECTYYQLEYVFVKQRAEANWSRRPPYSLPPFEVALPISEKLPSEKFLPTSSGKTGNIRY